MGTTIDKDLAVQRAVEDELVWSPDVDAGNIDVAVADGAVTLTGTVATGSERIAARHAALRVVGVGSAVDDLAVRPAEGDTLEVADVVKEVRHALSWASDVPDSVHAADRERSVTLTGEVDWDFQRDAATRAVSHLIGVDDVTNQITLSPRVSPDDAEIRIRSALARNAQLEGLGITPTVTGAEVTLTGTVRSAAEKLQAANAAWASPHVNTIINRIAVRRS